MDVTIDNGIEGTHSERCDTNSILVAEILPYIAILTQEFHARVHPVLVAAPPPLPNRACRGTVEEGHGQENPHLSTRLIKVCPIASPPHGHAK